MAKQMGLILKIVALVLVTIVVAAANGVSAGKPDKAGANGGTSKRRPVVIEFSPDSPDGVRIYSIKNPAGFGLVSYYINHSTIPTEYNPWHIQFIQPDGTVYSLLDRMRIHADGQPGPDAYAGGSSGFPTGFTVYGPTEKATVDWCCEKPPGTQGWIVFSWANQPGPIDFRVTFQPETVVAFVTDGSAESYSGQDYREGTRLGVKARGAGVKAHLADRLSVVAGDEQLWGYVFYMDSTEGEGSLVAERSGDGLRREQRLGGANTTCICFEWGRWTFTSDSDLRLKYEYIGDRGDANLLIGRIPRGTLPNNIWSEYIIV